MTDLPDALAVFSGENNVEYPVQEDDGAIEWGGEWDHNSQTEREPLSSAVRMSVGLFSWPRGGRGNILVTSKELLPAVAQDLATKGVHEIPSCSLCHHLGTRKRLGLVRDGEVGAQANIGVPFVLWGAAAGRDTCDISTSRCFAKSHYDYSYLFFFPRKRPSLLVRPKRERV